MRKFNLDQLGGDVPGRSWLAGLVIDIGMAVVGVSLAFGVRALLDLIGPKILIFAVCYPVLIFVTLLSGRRAGLIALALSCLVFWYAFVPDYYSFRTPSVVDATNVLLYVVVGLIVIWLCERHRRTLTKLRTEKARNELLMREMQHRARNGLAVVSTIVRQSLRHDPDAAGRIQGRLSALRDAEDMMWSGSRAPVSIRALFERELASYDASQLRLEGPALDVEGELARTLCLIVHELATNAAKYGAWSKDGGVVTLAWEEGPAVTTLRWTERGGPPPVAGPKQGFGTFLISRLLRQHDGSIHSEFTADGLRSTIVFARASRDDAALLPSSAA